MTNTDDTNSIPSDEPKRMPQSLPISDALRNDLLIEIARNQELLVRCNSIGQSETFYGLMIKSDIDCAHKAIAKADTTKASEVYERLKNNQ